MQKPLEDSDSYFLESRTSDPTRRNRSRNARRKLVKHAVGLRKQEARESAKALVQTQRQVKKLLDRFFTALWKNEKNPRLPLQLPSHLKKIILPGLREYAQKMWSDKLLSKAKEQSGAAFRVE